MGVHQNTLRVHFETEDFARTRVQHTPDPLWETLLSLHLLQGGFGQPVFGEWRSWVRQRLDRSALAADLTELAASRSLPSSAPSVAAGVRPTSRLSPLCSSGMIPGFADKAPAYNGHDRAGRRGRRPGARAGRTTG
jgi:hypothetical protein